MLKIFDIKNNFYPILISTLLVLSVFNATEILLLVLFVIVCSLFYTKRYRLSDFRL